MHLVWTILSHDPCDVWRRSDFSLIFLMSFKEQRLPRKRDYQGRMSFYFLEGEWQIFSHRDRSKNPTNVRGFKSTFHGTKQF